MINTAKIKKAVVLLTLLVTFQLSAFSQTLDERLKEIDDYANVVMDTWKGPGMVILIGSRSTVSPLRACS